MEIATFQDIVKRKLENEIAYLGLDVETDEKIIRNDLSVPILRIKKEGATIGGEINLLDPYLAVENEGVPISEIFPVLENTAKEIAGLAAQNEIANINLEDFDLRLEKIKEHLGIEIFDTQMNAKFLEHIPTRTVANGTMAIAAYLNTGEQYRTLISDSIMEFIGSSKEEVLNAALENAMENEPVNIFHPHEMGLPIPVDEDSAFLTNRTQDLGAAVIAYPGVMEKIRKKMKGSFYILPINRNNFFIEAERMAGNHEDPDAIRDIIHKAIVRMASAEIPYDEIATFNVMYYNADNKELSVFEAVRI